MNDTDKIRITDDDVKSVRFDVPSPSPSPPPNPGGSQPRQWGTISGAATGSSGFTSTETLGGSFFLKSWVYLGLAGLVSAFFAWALCEPTFNDTGSPGFGNYVLFAFLVTFISIAYAITESLVERSATKAITKGLLALLIGLVLGFIFDFIANIIFAIGVNLIAESGGKVLPENPALWIVRAIAWMVFGVAGGVVYGIAGQSAKKCLYGVLGGLVGAGIGGLFFDPICLITNGGSASRCVGMMIIGASTGIAIGLVESALKNRWLYVSAGPLAGKQFILYKPITRLGGDQTNDIYLFKDLSIAPNHATIELRGLHSALVANGPTFVGGQPVTQIVLRSGDAIQIGRYTFQYQEKRAQDRQ